MKSGFLSLLVEEELIFRLLVGREAGLGDLLESRLPDPRNRAEKTMSKERRLLVGHGED